MFIYSHGFLWEMEMVDSTQIQENKVFLAQNMKLRQTTCPFGTATRIGCNQTPTLHHGSAFDKQIESAMGSSRSQLLGGSSKDLQVVGNPFRNPKKAIWKGNNPGNFPNVT